MIIMKNNKTELLRHQVNNLLTQYNQAMYTDKFQGLLNKLNKEQNAKFKPIRLDLNEPINQYSLDSSKLIKHYSSIREAELYGYSYEAILQCLDGRISKAYESTWRLA